MTLPYRKFAGVKISTIGSGDEEDVHNDAGIRSKSQNVKHSKY